VIFLEDNKELVTEIERLRAELQQKCTSTTLTAEEVLLLSEKLDKLINQYLRLMLKKEAEKFE
jgi:cell division septum initiation protein DivIVA